MKEQYRQVGRSTHFHHYIYKNRTLCTFKREPTLLVGFFQINITAFSKILKKSDKRIRTETREERLAEISAKHSYLEGLVFPEMMVEVREMLEK